MNNFIEIQNKLINAAQNLFDKQDRVDAVTFNGKEFIIFINTHASSRPQITQYINIGGKGYDELIKIIND